VGEVRQVIVSVWACLAGWVIGCWRVSVVGQGDTEAGKQGDEFGGDLTGIDQLVQVLARQSCHRPVPSSGFVSFVGVGLAKGQVGRRMLVPACRDRQRCLEV
jgi:hypothetical protein